MTITAIRMNPTSQDGGVLCQLEDGRVFVTLSDQISRYVEPLDADALPAFNRAWTHNPSLFAGPLTPRSVALPEPERQGMAMEMSEADRQRLFKIIDKHWRAYFAAPPTLHQKMNLIDGLGARVATKIVRKHLDAGLIG